MRPMSEIRPFGADAARCRESFVQTHVRRMRCVAERVERDDVDTLHSLADVSRHFLAVAEVGEFLATSLAKKITGATHLPVRQLEGGDLQVANFKWARNDMFFRNK